MAISDIARRAADSVWDGAMPSAALLSNRLALWPFGPGPVATSGAHFLASLMFLRNLPAREFGLFSFVMVVVPFAMSMTASLVMVPVTRSLVTGEDGTRPICFQMNWLVCTAFAALLFAALLCGHAPLDGRVLLGLFGGVFTFRWFARCFALCRRPHGRRHRVRYCL